MQISCAMMASRVTPPAEDEEAEVDGAVEVGGVTVLVWGHLGLSCVSLCLTVAMSMTLIIEK